MADGIARGRRIGSVGIASRAFVGLALLYMAGGGGGLSWAIEWWDPVIGLVALPAIMVGLGLTARRHDQGPMRFTSPVAIRINCAAILVLVANPYTGPGALLFYGATLLVAAWRRQPGCEATVLSNIILRRDDQIGCPTFTPVDTWEARHRAGRGPRPAQVNR